MKYFSFILFFVVRVVFQNDLNAQCVGALSLQLTGSSTGTNTTTTITAQPTPLTKISIDSSFTLSVSATGSNLTYQWWKDNEKLNFITLSSYTVTSASYTDAGNYKVVAHGDCGVDITSDFALVQLTPLPLSWLDFKTKLIANNQVQLDWITISEINVKQFIVERSADGINFEPIIKPIIARNTLSQNNYSAIDAQPFSGLGYYRLKELDFDGRQTYSQVRSINNVEAEINFKIFPNPSSMNSVLAISTNWNEDFNFELFDVSGKIVYQKFKLKGNLIELNGMSLAGGVYFYNCKTLKNTVTGKFVVSQ